MRTEQTFQVLENGAEKEEKIKTVEENEETGGPLAGAACDTGVPLCRV